MEPSWTFPIPQAMQQHRGSQVPRPEPAGHKEAAPPAEAVKGAAAAASRESVVAQR